MHQQYTLKKEKIYQIDIKIKCVYKYIFLEYDYSFLYYTYPEKKEKITNADFFSVLITEK